MSAGNLESLHRCINYLRISVTDRCNLRCIYCMSHRETPWLDHAEVLTYEEILEVVKAGVDLGVRKVRLTGGEPLVRKNIYQFVQAISGINGISDLALTTNGVLLKQTAKPLLEAGLTQINVSLDTLHALKFIKITGRDYYRQVWEGIEAAESAGFNRIKLNMVVIRGMNDDELESFARLSCEKPFAVRFIEYMPIGQGNGWAPSKFIPIDEMKTRLSGLGVLHRIPSSSLDGPSERFRFKEAKGEIGFIGAVSQHFCSSCNRLRLTSDGRLRPCLMSDMELDVKRPLRRGCSREELLELLRSAIALKPPGRHFYNPGDSRCLRSMSTIGG